MKKMCIRDRSRASLFEYSGLFYNSNFSYVTDDYYGLLDNVSEEALDKPNSICIGVGLSLIHIYSSFYKDHV